MLIRRWGSFHCPLPIPMVTPYPLPLPPFGGLPFGQSPGPSGFSLQSLSGLSWDATRFRQKSITLCGKIRSGSSFRIAVPRWSRLRAGAACRAGRVPRERAITRTRAQTLRLNIRLPSKPVTDQRGRPPPLPREGWPWSPAAKKRYVSDYNSFVESAEGAARLGDRIGHK